MARRRIGFNMNMQTLIRPLFNIVVAGFILAFVGSFIAGFGDVTGLIISAIALILVIPMILKMRPGTETITSLILAIPLGTVLVGLLSSLFNITLPGLDGIGAFGTLSFALAFASYFTADLLYLMFFRKRR